MSNIDIHLDHQRIGFERFRIIVHELILVKVYVIVVMRHYEYQNLWDKKEFVKKHHDSNLEKCQELLVLGLEIEPFLTTQLV